MTSLPWVLKVEVCWELPLNGKELVGIKLASVKTSLARISNTDWKASCDVMCLMHHS